jgi:hypothetical protein
MVNATSVINVTLNVTHIDDDERTFYNRYMIVVLVIFGFFWIIFFKKIFYWFVRDVTGLMIWYNVRELHRRLLLQTSNDTHKVNGLNAWGLDTIEPLKKHENIYALLKKSDNGSLPNTYYSYNNLDIVQPQTVTIVPTHEGYKPVVESLQIYEDNVIDTNLKDVEGLKRRNVKSKFDKKTQPKKPSSSTHSNVDASADPYYHDDSNYFRKDVATFENTRDEKINFNDGSDDSSDEESYDASKKRKNKSSCARFFDGKKRWLARVFACDQYRTKSKKKCCPCMLNIYSAYNKKTKTNKKTRRSDYYERTVEDPNDELSNDVNDWKRFWRGTFFIMLCDLVVVLSIGLIVYGIYLSLDVEMDKYFSAQNLAFILAAFKLSELSGGLIGYISIISHCTIYRGDIVKIIGTWTGIGGSVSGVVIDVNISDVLLFSNTPFVSHFTKNMENTEKYKTQQQQRIFTNVAKPGLGTSVRDEDVASNDDSRTSGSNAVHTKRYFPMRAAMSIPKMRGKITEEQLKSMAKEMGGRFEKKKSDEEPRDPNVEMETIAYIRFDQTELDPIDNNASVQLYRTIDDIEIIRMNTNLVHGSVISRKVGFETNAHIVFNS